MFKVFSTREVAVGIYGLLAIILACTNKKIRIAVIGVVKATCQKPFLVLFFWVWMYVTGIIYCMCELHLWKWVFLKDVFIWVVFAGAPLSFKAAWRKVEEGFFRTMIRENLKLVVLVEFIINSFTFSLMTEMILQPILWVLTSLQSFSETKEEWKPAKNFFDIVVSMVSLVFLGFTFRTAIRTFSIEGVPDLLVTFCVPILLSICYVPVVYVLALRAKYRELFVRIVIRGVNNKREIRKRKWAVVLACGASYRKICEFSRRYYCSYIPAIKSANDDSRFIQFLNDFRTDYSNERKKR